MDDERCASLAWIVADTPLDCLTLAQVGRRFHDISGDAATTALIFSAAFDRGHAAIVGGAQSEEQIILTLKVMKECEPVLWQATESRGDGGYIDDVYLLSKDLIQYVRADDPSLGWAVGWAKIGIAECFYLKKQNQEALAEIEKIDSATLDSEQRLGLHWIHGSCAAGACSACRFDSAL